MNPPSGVLFLPTQILNICGSAAVIAEVKEKFMKCGFVVAKRRGLSAQPISLQVSLRPSIFP